MYKNCTLLCGTRPKKSLVKAIQVATSIMIIAQTQNSCVRQIQFVENGKTFMLAVTHQFDPYDNRKSLNFERFKTRFCFSKGL